MGVDYSHNTPPAKMVICFPKPLLAKIGIPIHPHMLRHSTGFKLANDGRDTRSIQHYLGHKNIQHTVRYTEIAAIRFKEFWSD